MSMNEFSVLFDFHQFSGIHGVQDLVRILGPPKSGGKVKKLKKKIVNRELRTVPYQNCAKYQGLTPDDCVKSLQMIALCLISVNQPVGT